MGAMRVHLLKDEYLSAVDNLLGLPEDLRRLVAFTEKIATDCLADIFRRDGTPAIVHSRALALKAWEMDLSPEGQAIAWLHDVLEENRVITPWDIYWSIGPYYGSTIINGVIALTKYDWMTDKSYFGRIEEASSLNWEIIVVKMIDRWHFHSDSYNGSVTKELAKIRQTRGIFYKTCLSCRKLIPLHFIPKYDALLGDVMELSSVRYRALTCS